MFLAGYPITPASEILHQMSGYKRFGVTTFQAEDEISAICAAIGASYAGKIGVKFPSRLAGNKLRLSSPSACRRGASDGMFWRFLAADDQRADAAIFRDVDSRISEREAHAVQEWLASGRAFHIMRDHPRHWRPMMGGMWGVRPGALPPIRGLYTRWRRKRWYPRLEKCSRPQT